MVLSEAAIFEAEVRAYSLASYALEYWEKTRRDFTLSIQSITLTYLGVEGRRKGCRVPNGQEGMRQKYSDCITDVHNALDMLYCSSRDINLGNLAAITGKVKDLLPRLEISYTEMTETYTKLKDPYINSLQEGVLGDEAEWLNWVVEKFSTSAEEVHKLTKDILEVTREFLTWGDYL